MQNSRKNWSLFLAKALPYIFISVVMVALITSAALGRPDLAASGSYLLIPAILVAVFAMPGSNLVKQGLTATSARLRLSSRSFSYFALLFGVLYLFSLALLIGNESRPPLYFCLTALMAGLIFLEILSVDQMQGGRKGVILLQIAFLSANLVFGQTLKLPLYTGGGGDILAHMRYASTIVESGYITSAMHGYQAFPLFHTLVANGSTLTGMNVQTSHFLISGLAFTVSIPLIYLVVSRATKDIHLPLLAALVYSQSQIFLFKGMYTAPRDIVYVLFLLGLYLLISARKRQRFGIMAIFLIPALVLMHHVTLVYISVVLVALIIMEFLTSRRFRYIEPIFLTTLVIAFLGYWSYNGLLAGAVSVITSGGATPVPDATPFESSYSAVVASSFWIPSSARLSQEPFIALALRYASFSVLAFMAVLGIVSQLYKRGKESPLAVIFTLLALIALPIYFPGPLTHFPSLFMLNRMTILLSPFIVFAAAGGLLVFVAFGKIRQRLKSATTLAIGLLLIALLSFSSVTILGNETDLNIGKIVGTRSSSYFTQAELDSFAFTAEHSGDAPVYADYHSWRYLEVYADTPAISSTDVFDTELLEEGCFVFRRDELERKGQLLFLTAFGLGFGGELYAYRASDDPSLEAVWAEQDKIFDNGAVQIYLMRNP